MLKRELSTPRKHYCIGGDNAGDGSSGDSKKTYDLKIIRIEEKIYIDKSPELVYADFSNLIQQRYYIKYAEGNVHMSFPDIDGVIDMPLCYTGTCRSGASIFSRAIADNNEDSYILEFSTVDFSISITGAFDGVPEPLPYVEIRLNSTEDSVIPTQYNDEDLGDRYIIWDLSFVWESID